MFACWLASLVPLLFKAIYADERFFSESKIVLRFISKVDGALKWAILVKKIAFDDSRRTP